MESAKKIDGLMDRCEKQTLISSDSHSSNPQQTSPASGGLGAIKELLDVIQEQFINILFLF